MRRMMWFAIGFGLGCAVWVYAGLDRLLPAGIALCLSALFVLIPGKHRPLAVASVILLGMAGSGFWFQGYRHLVLEPVAALDGVTREAEIVTTDYPVSAGYRLVVDGRIALDGKTYPVRAYIPSQEAFSPGTVLTGTFRFRLTTPQGEQSSAAQAGRGIFLQALSEGSLSMKACRGDTLLTAVARFRQGLSETLKQCVPEDVYGFAKALLLGDTRDLSYEVDSALKISGIRHVAAVSGLHVSILFALLSGVLLRKRVLCSAVGIPLLLGIAALAGFTPSVNRACIMCSLMLLSGLLKREYDAATALSVAVLVMLQWNPYAIASVSLQLSVASVTGILLFAQPLRAWLCGVIGYRGGKSGRERLKRWISLSVSTTLGAMAFTVPLSGWYFGMVSLIGIVTNLLTLWVISLVFYGLLAACGLYLLRPALGVLVGDVTGFGIRYILLVAKWMAKLPLAAVYTMSPYIVLWLVLVYVLLALLLLQKRRKPGQLILCCLLGLCLSLWCSWAEPICSDTVMTVLDVGEGQCILLHSQGRWFLVDCGGDDGKAAADLAAARLGSWGISRLDGLILTHGDQDHMGGVPYLLSRVETEMVIVPQSPEMPAGENTLVADRVLQLSWENTQMTIFGDEFRGDSNENSLCILLNTENCDILITSDRSAAGEKRLLDTGRVPKVDVLVAGHHGSAYATSRLLLEQVQPRVVCISVGRDNRYGHPAVETLRRLQEAGCQVYRTDMNGTILIRR